MADPELAPLSPFTSAHALAQADAIDVEEPRGEARRLLADVAEAPAAREHAATAGNPYHAVVARRAGAADLPG